MIKTEQLYDLVQVAKYNSITLAAKEMFLTKSAVSTAIKQLERECGFEILVRTYRGVKFTTNGELVLEYARQVLQILENMTHLGAANSFPQQRARRDLYIEKSLMPLLQSKLILTSRGVLDEYNIREVTESDGAIAALDAENLAIIIVKDDELAQMRQEPEILLTEVFCSKYYPVSCKGTKWLESSVQSMTKQEYALLPKIVLGYRNGYEGDETVVLQTDNSNVYANAILNDLGIGLLTNFSQDLFVVNHKLFKVYAPIDDKMVHIVMAMANAGDLARGERLESVLKER